jgi:ring-1,2-phenylacetyl-CoA epoxidase subunit PaaE
MIIKVLIDDKFHQVEQKPGETILDTLIRSDVDVPYSCKLGYCSVCKCRLESGEIDVEDDSILTKKEKNEGYILTCQSYPTSDVNLSFDYL